jgi:hypothetical protein
MVQSPSILGDDLIMKRTIDTTNRGATERKALRRRVKQFYRRFNEADWEGCFTLIDPQLTQAGKVKLDTYSERMQNFKDAYGSVKPWYTRLSLHLDATSKQGDRRPFAYVYLIWQDDTHAFHLFRERWIKEDDLWFTRVLGLVPNRFEIDSM